MTRRISVLLVALVAVAAPRAALADLRVHGEGGGVAPIDPLLRQIGPGFNGSLAVDYEVVSLLSVGVFYNLGYFMCSDFDCPGARAPEDRPILDHAAGARLGLRLVRHRHAGWFGSTTGDLYGEAFLELDLAYHNIGQQSRMGWGFGLGYRVVAAGPFGLGPVFRFRHIVAGEPDPVTGEPVHQLYVSFGIAVFLTFDLTGGRTASEPARPPGGRESGRADEWEEI